MADFCLILFWICSWQQWVWTWSPFYPCIKKFVTRSQVAVCLPLAHSHLRVSRIFFHSEWHTLCLEHLSCYTGKHYSSLCTLVHICSCSVPGVVPRHVPGVVPIDVPSSSSFCNIVRHSHKTGNRILSMC
jgi:hypothetical protein